MNAYEEVMEMMSEEEVVTGIVFGAWGWGDPPQDGEGWAPHHAEPDPPPVPFDKRGVVMSIDEAKQYMSGWRFSGGYGAPECYAVYIWTNLNVYWVIQYDGATGLCCAPCAPRNTIPEMPGG